MDAIWWSAMRNRHSARKTGNFTSIWTKRKEAEVKEPVQGFARVCEGEPLQLTLQYEDPLTGESWMAGGIEQYPDGSETADEQGTD